MRGNLTRRGRSSWRLKFDLARQDGKRVTKFKTFRGNKIDVERQVAQFLGELAGGRYVDASKTTVADYVEFWLDRHDAEIGSTTHTRYAGLLRKHVVPRIGDIVLQQLKAEHLKGVYADMAKAGLAPRTRLHTHRVVHLALRHAVQWDILTSNIAAKLDAPRVRDDEEIVIPTAAETKLILAKTAGNLASVVCVMFGAGLRRGEICALRWSHLDLGDTTGTLKARQTLEQSKRGGLEFKPPKSKYGKRDLPLAPSTVALLKTLRRQRQEEYLAAGLGRLLDDALVFGDPEGNPLKPATLTQLWKRFAARHKLKHITLHSLRHAYASALISAGLDVQTVSRRLGHHSAGFTLRVYGHLFREKHDETAAAIEEAFHS